MLFGRPVTVNNLDMFDEIIEGDILDSAINFAKDVIKHNLPVRRTRDLKLTDPLAKSYLEYVHQTAKATSKNNPAPLQLVELMMKGLNKSFIEGIDLESQSVKSLSLTKESKAKQHLFLAEKSVWKIPDVPENTVLREIKNIGIIGSGVMASGLAIVFLSAGFPVRLRARSRDSADKCIAVVHRHFENLIQKGKLSQENADKYMSGIQGVLVYDDLKDTDLIIEASLEDMALKTEIFKQLDIIAKPGAILATNTSSLNLDKLAQATSRPEDVVGMHFFNPAPLMKLLEVVRGSKTSKEVIATVMDVCKRIKKTAVLSRVCDGFIGNRILFAYQAATLRLVEEGASPQDIDRILEKWGMALGPFKMQDIIGLDLLAAIRQRQYEENPGMVKDLIGDKLFAQGRMGQKNGLGWYKYQSGARTGSVDDDVVKLIEETRREIGASVRKISEDEILERCLYSIINEGSKILEEGIALRASDIDVVYVYGYGFPAYRGGPMLYGDTVSPNVVSHVLQRYGMKPSRLLQQLAEEGRTFNYELKGE